MPLTRSILAAVDLGPGSDDVVATAARLARATGAELHLMHVVEQVGESEVAVLAGVTDLPEGESEARKRIRELLERAAPGLHASTHVRTSPAPEAVLEVAREAAADLAIVGPHRGGGVSAHLLGTTAENVVRRARLPCLVAGHPLALPLGEVGMATDLSEESRPAFDAAADWARALGAGRVRVVHVARTIDRDSSLEEEVLGSGMPRFLDPQPQDVELVPELVWAEDEAEGVVTWAANRRVDLLVLGSHGRGRLERAVLGSTAQSVARRAPCPVLLIPAAGTA